MTICRKCGTSNQDGKKFCVFCNELLIADPEELAKREAAEQKKRQKLQKKLDAKHKRWKRAPLLLIPIGLLDVIDLILCLDLAFIGIGAKIGNLIGELIGNSIGSVVHLFGNAVYTNQLAEYIIRGLELLGAFAILLVASVLGIFMIVRMVKWRIYRTKGDKAEQALQQAAQKSGQAEQTEQKPLPVQEAGEEAVRAAVGEQKVSYAALAQLAGQLAEYEMPDPVSEVDCKQMYAALMPQLWEYDEDSVRRILSAVCASRMLLCSAGALDSASIFENLSRAFAVKAEQYACASQDGEGATRGLARVLLQRDAQTGELSHSSFVKALYTAGVSPRNVCFAGVGGVEAANTEDVFGAMAPYFGLPDGSVSLYLGQADAKSTKMPTGIEECKLTLSSNLWILSVLPESDHAPTVGDAIGKYCATVYLRNSGKAFPPEEAENVQPLVPSVDALERAVAAAEETYYLAEEHWHVLDLIEQQVLEMGGVRLSNRTLRMLERYTAVYLATGAKQSEAFDNGFAAIVLPAYAQQLAKLANREQGETLAALLERTAGRDRLPVTFEVLSSMDLI